MKKLFTTVFMMSLLTAPFVLNAQTNITPQRYNFAFQPLGPYSMDKQQNGYNPVALDPDVKDHWNNGFIILTGGSFATSLDFTDGGQGAMANSAFQIYDLGGEVGRVLMIKGADSEYPLGVPGDAGFNNNAWAMNIFTDPVLTPNVNTLIEQGDDPGTAVAKATVRMRMVFNIQQNVIKDTRFLNMLAYTYSSVTKKDEFGANAFTPDITSSQFTTDGVYDPTKWMIYEYDFVAGEPNQAPLRYKVAFVDTKIGTLLIRELSFTANPSGSPKEGEFITLTPAGTTSISSMKDQSGINIYTESGQLYLKNVTPGSDIAVYSISGVLIESFKTQDAELSLPLADGVYIVQVGTVTKKVVVLK